MIPMVCPAPLAVAGNWYACGDLDGRVGDGDGVGGDIWLCAVSCGRLFDAKVRLRLRPVIQTENGHYGTDQRCRQMNAALANAILLLLDRLLLQFDAEGSLHVGGGAGKAQGPTRNRGRIRFHGQVELARKRPHQGDIRRIRA